jgi:hypothetical protein
MQRAVGCYHDVWDDGFIGGDWPDLLDYRCNAAEAGVALGGGHDGGACLDDDALAGAKV